MLAAREEFAAFQHGQFGADKSFVNFGKFGVDGVEIDNEAGNRDPGEASADFETRQ